MRIGEPIYRPGLPEKFRSRAALLYDQAFGEKFSVAVRSMESRILLLNNCFLPEYAIVAELDQKLIGVAGFHTPTGSFTGGITYRGLLSQLGFIKGNWAAFIFSLYARKPSPGELVMDGIAVDVDARGKGVGGRLLDEVAAYARDHGFDHVRLDVIDINPKAKKLYERKGFKAVRTEFYPVLRRLLGFSASTTMLLDLSEQ